MELNYMGSGKVYLSNQKYRCTLYINENKGVILINIKLASSLELPMNIDFLVGVLDTGFKFSLISCKIQSVGNNLSEGSSTYTYRSKYLIKGIGEKTDRNLKLNKMNFRVANILAWGGISAYKISDNFELSYDKDLKKEIYKNDEFVVAYWISNSMLPVISYDILNENIVLNQSGNITIIFKSEQTIDKFVKVFNKIKRLIEFSTLRNIYLSKLTGMSNNIYDIYDKKKRERLIEIISCDLNNEKSKVDYMETMRWINFSELIDNDSFSKYFSKYEIFEPIIELYLEIIYSKEISNIRVFLNIVQALETYHSRFKTNNLSDFKERIITKILNNRPKKFVKKDTAFLMANSYKFITLESRLADLLLADFKIHFNIGDIGYYDFPRVIANTRHYYIHYDETIKERSRVLTEKELSIYNSSLFYILEYYILIELGFTDMMKIKKILNKRWRNSKTLSIINTQMKYKKRDNNVE